VASQQVEAVAEQQLVVEFFAAALAQNVLGEELKFLASGRAAGGVGKGLPHGADAQRFGFHEKNKVEAVGERGDRLPRGRQPADIVEAKLSQKKYSLKTLSLSAGMAHANTSFLSLKNHLLIMTQTLTPLPVYCALYYIWFGCWSLGYLVFIGWVKPAKDALVDWMMEWENFEWASQHLGLVLLLVLVWPLTWIMIFRYWK